MSTSLQKTNAASRRCSRERGEGATSYIAATLLIAAFTAVLATSNVGGAMVSGTERALCQVAGDGCRPVDGKSAALSDDGATPAGTTGQRNPGAQALSPDSIDAPKAAAVPPSATPRYSPAPIPLAPRKEWLREHGVATKYREGGGHAYDKKSLQVFIDTTKQQGRDPVYEAAWKHMVTQELDLDSYYEAHSDTDRESQTDYVDGRLDSLASSIGRQISLTKELQKTKFGKQVPDAPYQKLYDEAYEEGRQRKEKQLRTAGLEITLGETSSAGNAEAEEAIKQELEKDPQPLSLPNAALFEKQWTDARN